MKLYLLLFSALAAGVVSGAAASSSTNLSRPDLTGRILTPNASPLADASVFIDSAGPKVGRGTL